MCRAVKCKQCGKTTWAGCGQHIEEVRRSVPAADWCPGHPKQPKGTGQGSRFVRLFGGSRRR
jgi:hypothetical protein